MSYSDVVTRRSTVLAALIALLAAVGWFAAAESASAGGPTSVLLANPQTGRVAALYHTDQAYDRLARAVGAFASQTGSTLKPAAVTDDFRGEVRLTWLIHDMSIWRIDRVHATTQDGVWIETVLLGNGRDQSDLFDQPSAWHRPVDPKGLTATLRDAGLLERSAADNDSPTIPASDLSSAAADGAVPTAASPKGGLVAAVAAGGVLIGATGSTLLRRTRAGRQDQTVLNG